MLSNIHAAIAAGAKGVAIGRNVFQSDDPEAMTRSIVAIVHQNASVDDALMTLRG
jgi:DhnA family fructose-bisphosphate aldolase class Ia